MVNNAKLSLPYIGSTYASPRAPKIESCQVYMDLDLVHLGLLKVTYLVQFGFN